MAKNQTKIKSLRQKCCHQLTIKIQILLISEITFTKKTPNRTHHLIGYSISLLIDPISLSIAPEVHLVHQGRLAYLAYQVRLAHRDVYDVHGVRDDLFRHDVDGVRHGVHDDLFRHDVVDGDVLFHHVVDVDDAFRHGVVDEDDAFRHGVDDVFHRDHDVVDVAYLLRLCA